MGAATNKRNEVVTDFSGNKQLLELAANRKLIHYPISSRKTGLSMPATISSSSPTRQTTI